MVADLAPFDGGQFLRRDPRLGGEIGVAEMPAALGFAKKLTGSATPGFLIFASLAVVALLGLTMVKTRWWTTWGAAVQGVRI